jgi:hypothetical protein
MLILYALIITKKGIAAVVIAIVIAIVKHGNTPQDLPITLSEEEVGFGVLVERVLQAVKDELHIRDHGWHPEGVIFIQLKGKVNELANIFGVGGVDLADAHGFLRRGLLMTFPY